MEELSCKKCSSNGYVKAGHVRGIQRYKCRECGCQFTHTKPRGVNPARCNPPHFAITSPHVRNTIKSNRHLWL